MKCATHDAPVIFGVQNGQGFIICAAGQHALLTVDENEHEFAMKLQEHQIDHHLAPQEASQ